MHSHKIVRQLLISSIFNGRGYTENQMGLPFFFNCCPLHILHPSHLLEGGRELEPIQQKINRLTVDKDIASTSKKGTQQKFLLIIRMLTLSISTY